VTFATPAMLPLLVSDLKLTLSSSAWWYVLLAFAALAFAFAVYRYTMPPVSSLRRSLLWVLRGLALVLILLLIFEPVLSFLFNRTEERSIALLIDQSASMSIDDESGNRGERVKDFLSSGELKRLNSTGRLRVFAFADSVSEIPVDSLSSLRFAGIGSNLAGGWQQAEQSLAGKNLAAIVVVSDGIQNLGPNPVRVASESSVPIYTIGVGDTTLQKDAVISEILTNEITYVGSKVPVDIRVRADGLPNQSSRIRLLRSNGREIASEPIRFSSQQSEIPISLEFTADEPGDVRLIAVLDSVPGEKSLANNRRSVIIRVLDSKSQTLLLSGPPTADLTFLRQALESDTALDVNTFIELGGRYLNGRSAPTDEMIRDAELIVLINYPTSNTPPSNLASIKQAAESHNTPALFFAGPNLSRDRMSTLSGVLPAQLAKTNPTANRVVVRAASSHPLLTGSDYNPAQWLELPPVLGGIGNFEVDAGALTLVKLSRESAGVEEDEPAVVLAERTGRRAAAILCWDTFRWKIGMVKEGAASEFYDDLISRTVNWLIAPVEEQRVKVTTSKKLYSGGESVRFIGQVYGTDLKPRDDAAIDLRVESGDRVEVVPMKNRGNGRYEGEFTPWSDGDFKFKAAAAVGQDTLGSDQGRFAIEAFNIELIDSRSRFDELRQIAEKSGASFAEIDNAGGLLSQLKFDPVSIITGREIPLWNRAMMLWIIIILLAAEWTLRKRSGML
jgi:hypothetical protein